MKCHCDKQPDPSGYVASLCDHGHTNPTGSRTWNTLSSNSQASINPINLYTNPTIYRHTQLLWLCTYVYAQGYSCNILPDICISPIIAYVKIRTSCMQKHNCKTKLCHSFHEIRFIIKTHIMVRNMIYSLLLLYNCAYTLPITDIRIKCWRWWQLLSVLYSCPGMPNWRHADLFMALVHQHNT